MSLELDQRIERLLELRDLKKEIEREIRELLGETNPGEDHEKTKRRVVRYEKSMEDYVLQILAPGGLLTRDEIFRQIRFAAGATLRRQTVNNAISSLKRKGAIEKSMDGDIWSIKSMPVEPHQASLAPPSNP